MCFKKILAFFQAKPQPQPEQAPTKRNRVRAIGKYKPKADYVRLTNVAQAAGVSTQVVAEAAKETGANVFHFIGESHAMVTKADAVELHTYICKNK